MPEITLIISALTTLFVTIDPIGLGPIFIGVTDEMSDKQKRTVAIRASIIGLVLLFGFAIVGSKLLGSLGISLAAFQIAGGLLLFYVAFEMIFEKRQERQQATAERAMSDDEAHSMAVFPLAIPMIAGPGAISAAVLLSTEFTGAIGLIWLLGIITAIMVLVLLAFTLSDQLNRLLGQTGRAIVTRLLGVLLAALSVQFVGDGIFGMIDLAAA